MKPTQLVLLSTILLLNTVTANITHAVTMDLNYDFINIYNLQDKKKEAIKIIESNISKSYEKYYVLGILYLPEDPVKAKEEFLKVIKAKPDHIKSYLNLGYLSLNSNIQESIDYFNNALKYDQTIAEMYNALAIAYMSQNNMLEAINTLEKGLQSVGKEESLYFNQSLILSKYFVDTKEDEKIIRNMTAAISIKTREEYFIILGNYYLRKNQNSAAQKVFIKAVDNYPRSIYCILGLSTTYKNTNEYDRAISIARKALEISPDNKLVLDEIKEIEETSKALNKP